MRITTHNARALPNASRNGFSLIEMAIVLAISGIFVMGLFTLAMQYFQHREDAAIAGQLTQLAQATAQYSTANATTLTTTQEISLATLQSPTAYLNADFNSTNGLGETYHAGVLVTGSTITVIAWATGGTTLPDTRGGDISALIGAQGGFIYSYDTSATPAPIRGSLGGYTVPASTYSQLGANAPTTGYPIYVNFNTNSNLLDDDLRRHPYPAAGQPSAFEGNNMHATLMMGDSSPGTDGGGAPNILMNGNNVQNTGDITTKTLEASSTIAVGGAAAPTVTGSIAATGSLGVGMSAPGTAGNIAANGNITANSNVSADSNVSAGGNVSASGNISANGSLGIGTAAPATAGNIAATGNIATSGGSLGIGNTAPSGSGNILATGNISIGGTASAPATSYGTSNLSAFYSAQTLYGGTSLWYDAANGAVPNTGDFIGNGFYGNQMAAKAMYASAFFYYSDQRLKQDIVPLQNALDNLLRLHGVAFKWKGDGKPDIGLIAQDVEKIFPELVADSPGGFKAVEYSHLIAPTIEAIRQLHDELAEIRAELSALQTARVAANQQKE